MRGDQQKLTRLTSTNAWKNQKECFDLKALTSAESVVRNKKQA